MPVCVARAGREGGACMLVVLAGHDGSHGCAAPGPARMCRCCSGVTGFPRCSLLLRVQVRTCGGRPCLQGWVRWGGGAHSSYLCLPVHVEEPGVASGIRWQFTAWAQLQAGGPSGGPHRQWRTATVGPGQKVAVAVGVSGRCPQEVRP